MKILMCNKCDRKQTTGKYCLDCGSELTSVITSSVKFKKIDSNRTSDHLKRDIRNWLGRIGVQNPDIKISTAGAESRVEYVLDGKTYSFSSHLQDSITNNIAAIEQFLHGRVLSIERGIETMERAFAGYAALPDYSNPYQVLGFEKEVPLAEAKSKFNELAKQLHPDVAIDRAGAHERFLTISAALKKIEEMEKNGS